MLVCFLESFSYNLSFVSPDASKIPTQERKDDQVAAECERQITQMLYRNNGFAIGLSAAVSILVAAGNLAMSGPPVLIALWLSIFLGIQGWRYWLLWRARRYFANGGEPTMASRAPVLQGIVVSAIGWALAGVMLLPTGNFEARLFTAVVIVSSTTGAIPQTGIWAKAYLSYLIISMVPVALVLLLHPVEQIDMVLGLAVFLYMVTANGGAKRFRSSMLDSVRLGVERAHLIRELEEARDRAHASSRAKTEFLANVSHEIRTPINAILGFSDMALDDPRSDDMPRHLNGIRRSARALLSLVNDVLDMSKIESGMLTTEQTCFSLDETIAGLLDIYSTEAHRKGLRLQIDRADDVPDLIRTDPLRLHQVLSNLLSNAVKFTERGQVTLSVKQVESREHWRRLLFAVTDTGIGLTREQSEHIFDSFSQADTSTTRRYGGTGLGLSISRQLVRLLGGTGIVVASQRGRGSRFSFELPVTVAESAEPASDARATLRPPGDAEHMRVLLGEDCDDNRFIIGNMIERAGHHIWSAHNGLEAVRHAESEEFDAIILDMHMPEMDGLEATCRIRQHEIMAGRPRTPIIMLTASVRPENREACLAAGADRYLLKPVDAEQLIAALTSLHDSLDMP